MTHKLVYGLTKEKRIILEKIVPNIDNAIYEALRNTAISVFNDLNDGKRILPDGREVKFKIEKVDAVKIPLTPAEYIGQKSVLICSAGLYIDLVNACKLDNYLRDKDGAEMISFNQFIHNLVNAFVNSIIASHRKQVLDAEMNQIKSETPIKTKK